MVEIPGTAEFCALAVGKNNVHLLQEINKVLDSMALDGTLTKLKQKWDF